MEMNRKKRNLMYFLKPYLWWYFVGWIFLILSSSAGLMFPYLMGKLLGSGSSSVGVSTPSSIEMLNFQNATEVAYGLFILFGFQALFSFLRVVIFNNVTEML